MNTPEFFEIQVSDIAIAKQFYADIFGWEFTKQAGLPIEYWHIETGGIQGGLFKRQARPAASRTATNAFTSSMRVASFDDTAAKIEALGGKVAMPKFAVPGKCWQGYFLDPDDNVFGLFEVDEKAA